MEMTLRAALKIQAKQVASYSWRRADLAEIVAKETNVEGCDLDAPMDMQEINSRVPRGWDIEQLLDVKEVAPVAWVDVKDMNEGPYEFHGIELLPAGKYNLYIHPAPSELDKHEV